MVSLVFGACEKPEELWELPPAGEETVAKVNMGPTYDNAVFFNIKTGESATRDVYSWHLGFASGENENAIILNGGNEVQLHSTGDTTFSTSYTVSASSEWLWDNPNGKVDSTAFSGWFDSTNNVSRNKVYVIDLGSKAKDRYKKIKIIGMKAISFTVKYASMDGSNEQTIDILKNAKTNYTYFNLETNKIVGFEPETFPWDIVFMRYRYVYYDMNPVTPYYVNGAIINTKYVQVKETNNVTFESLDLAKAKKFVLTKNADEIGYDWKKFDLNGTGKYVVDSKKVYLLKDDEGYLYKLKFVDFYDETGAKGVPKFAYQRL